MDFSYSKSYLIISIFLGAGLISVIQAQSFRDSSIFLFYDHLVSRENTGLYNGSQFIDLGLNAWDGSHIYLISDSYVNSKVVYNGQPYLNVPLKYDLVEDNLSIRSNDHLSIFKIKMIPARISGFSLHGLDFIKLNEPGLDLKGNGFFEVAAVGDSLALYIKHVKKKKRETIDKVLQYRFNSANYYVLRYKGAYHPIYSTKDFREVMPDRYLLIRSFYRQNKSLYKANPDEFMINVVNYLDLNQDQ